MTHQCLHFIKVLVPNIDFVIGKSVCGNYFVFLLTENYIADLTPCVFNSDQLSLMYVKNSQTPILGTSSAHQHSPFLLGSINSLHCSSVLLFHQWDLDFGRKDKQIIVITATRQILPVWRSFEPTHFLLVAPVHSHGPPHSKVVENDAAVPTPSSHLVSPQGNCTHSLIVVAEATQHLLPSDVEDATTTGCLPKYQIIADLVEGHIGDLRMFID